MTITEFLLARIGEDEQVAQAAFDEPPIWETDEDGNDVLLPPGHTWKSGGYRGEVVDNNLRQIVYDEGAPTAEQATHIARHDPARVLAECQAKRNLIEWALGLEHLRDVNDPDAPTQPLGDEVLRMLAAVYTDHSDFDPSWRVD